LTLGEQQKVIVEFRENPEQSFCYIFNKN
jgi:ubiquitin carboxyl-terminal hydrolase 4/11/15